MEMDSNRWDWAGWRRKSTVRMALIQLGWTDPMCPCHVTLSLENFHPHQFQRSWEVTDVGCLRCWAIPACPPAVSVPPYALQLTRSRFSHIFPNLRLQFLFNRTLVATFLLINHQSLCGAFLSHFSVTSQVPQHQKIVSRCWALEQPAK